MIFTSNKNKKKVIFFIISDSIEIFLPNYAYPMGRVKKTITQ